MSTIDPVSVQAEASDKSLAALFRNMNSSERRTFWACAAGWALDGMDFMIYPLVLGTITALWQIDRGTAGLAATLTLVFSAFGGWIAGFLSDRIGRVLTLQIAILWFSIFSLLCAVAQTFDQLLVARALLGIGFGGEWAAGAVLMGEAIRAEYRGRAVGAVQSGWAVGWGVAVLAQAVLFTVLPAEIAWRAMFGLGVLPALLIVYLRMHVEEPKIAIDARIVQKAAGTTPSIWEIFKPDILPTTFLAALMSTGAQGGYYAITTWLPTYLKAERNLSVVGSTPYLIFLIAGCFAGFLVGAWLADRIGRRMLFLVFSLGAIAIVLAYTQLPIPNGLVLILGFPLGFFASGYFSGMGPFLTELYPTRLRGSGQGFCYNFGRGIGALFPLSIGYISTHMSLANAMGLFATVAYGIFFLSAFALPETRGKILSAEQ